MNRVRRQLVSSGGRNLKNIEHPEVWLLGKTERRTSRESGRSSEGRRRAPLSSVFPEVQHQQIAVALLNQVVEELLYTAKEVAATQLIQTVPR